MIRRLSEGALLLLLPGIALAHDQVVQESCMPPNLNIDFYDDRALETLDREFAEFQLCISTYAQYETDQAMRHATASSEALEKLQEFSRRLYEAVPAELKKEWQEQSDASP